jgi:hypothetical protein
MKIARLLGPLVLLPFAAPAAMLYKSVGPNGVVEFSDVPPPEHHMLVEERVLPSRPSIESAARSVQAGVANVASAAAAGMPYVLEDLEGAVARANAQLDLAEHALAEALRSMGSPLQGMHLKSAPGAGPESARIEFYRRNVQLARQNLLEILHARTSTPDVTSLASR